MRYEHPPRPITQRGWRMSCLRRNYGAAATACRAARLINAPATLASASFALNSCFFPVRRSRVSGWARFFVFSAHVQAEAFDAMAGAAGRPATRASDVFLALTSPGPGSASYDGTEDYSRRFRGNASARQTICHRRGVCRRPRWMSPILSSGSINRSIGDVRVHSKSDGGSGRHPGLHHSRNGSRQCGLTALVTDWSLMLSLASPRSDLCDHAVHELSAPIEPTIA